MYLSTEKLRKPTYLRPLVTCATAASMKVEQSLHLSNGFTNRHEIWRDDANSLS